MGLLSFVKSVYDIDNLDTRFTTSSTVPYKTVIESRDSATGKRAVKPDAKAQPSKWRTPEFIFYLVALAWLIPHMFWIAYDVSRRSDPRYHKFEEHLSPGWIPGRKIDVSDSQYHSFRTNLPYMAILLVAHPMCRRLWNIVYPTPPSHGTKPASPEQADARKEQRVSFDFAFAILFLVALHGFSSLKVLAILYVNYQLATGLPRKYVTVATWVFNVGILFANELCAGYHYESIALLITGSPALGDSSTPEPSLVQWGAWLDSWGGIMSRWEILFNLTVLRLISFNLDYCWSQEGRGASPIEKKQLDPANLSERDRVTIPAEARDYSLRNYIAYAVYAPLYLTGPILTFNDYMWQVRYRPASIETPRTLRYALRFLLCLLAMELVLHYDYVGAISAGGPDWSTYTAAQLSMLSFFNLHIIWLKLLLPWRFFRLWALADGIDPPENMLRCVSDNYSTLSFWRAWHRSYNKWLIRYLYVPLGGADFGTWRKGARSVATYLLVFTFVALWHDIQLRLLIWGWLVVVFFLPEVLAGFLFPRRRWESRPTAYRMLCCAGAVGNVLMMISANLVGFAVGLDGMANILHSIFHDWSGMVFFVTACGALFVGVQVMFEIREEELRKGIKLRC